MILPAMADRDRGEGVGPRPIADDRPVTGGEFDHQVPFRTAALVALLQPQRCQCHF